MAILTTIATSVLAPFAGKLITHYLGPKIEPVVEKVKVLETAKDYFNGEKMSNSAKHTELTLFINSSPAISKFIKRCGWSRSEQKTVIKFLVLMAKKPITDKKSRDLWKKDDIQIVFDFLYIVAGKWIRRFGKKG
jgi:hypothetical protein